MHTIMYLRMKLEYPTELRMQETAGQSSRVKADHDDHRVLCLLVPSLVTVTLGCCNEKGLRYP